MVLLTLLHPHDLQNANLLIRGLVMVGSYAVSVFGIFKKVVLGIFMME